MLQKVVSCHQIKKIAVKTEEFIKKAKEVHKYIYDYSETIYIRNKSKVKIICKEHGEFEQTPALHKKGSA